MVLKQLFPLALFRVGCLIKPATSLETEVRRRIEEGVLHEGNSARSVTEEETDLKNFRNYFKMTIENYTNKKLINHEKHDHAGVVPDLSFAVIEPGYREKMYGRKTSSSATGVEGTVSWKIADTNKMVVVMYTLPYSFDFHSNWLAVGIFPLGDTHGYFDKMHSGPEDFFTRKQFYHNTHPVLYMADSQFEVSAKMGATHQETITLKIYPKQARNLAKKVKQEDNEDNSDSLLNLGVKIAKKIINEL